MANSFDGSVIYCDTNASFPQALEIAAVKYIGAASGTAVITSTVGSKNLWEESGSSNVFNQAGWYIQGGITVALTNSAKVYIYLRARGD